MPHHSQPQPITERPLRALPIGIEDATSDPLAETDLRGFTVFVDEPLRRSSVTGIEGYHLGTTPEGTEIADRDVFDLSWAWSTPERTGGVATDLVNRALGEAKKRGFDVGRASVRNARILSILQKLQAQGSVGEIRAFKPTGGDTMPTETLLAEAPEISLDKAKEFLNGAIEDETDDFSANDVDCVFEIV